MIIQKNTVPPIRFPGFTAPWEQRKFSDLFKERREKTTVEDEDVLLSCAITGIYLNSELFGHQRGRSNIGYLKIKMNDLILSAQNLHLGNANVNKRFEHGIISPAYKVFEIVDCNPDFIQAWVKQETTKKFFLDVTTEGASQCRKNIDWNLLANSTIPVPSEREQSVLGDFLFTLDKAITLHQRKCEELKNYKKGLLQKMFPQPGEAFPRVRFPGFTDPWEQRKLPEFVTFYNGLTYKPDDVRESGTLVLRSSNVKNGAVVDADNVYVDPNKANSENVKDGDIIVVVRNGSRALIGKHAEVKGAMPDTVIGAFMTGIRSEYPSFVNALLDTPQFDKEIEKNMGATINQITGYMFSKMEFFIPSSHEEQKQIGALFKSLDDTITLHQRKCEELKNYKKGMLQKMFV